MYTASHNADLGDIIVNTIKAIPRPENPTIYDASIPTYDKDNPLSFWNPATIEVNALNGYTTIEFRGTADKADGKLIVERTLETGITTYQIETTSIVRQIQASYTLNITRDRDILMYRSICK